MNPKVNGQIQTHWRWLIAAYLFLGGVGAGAYTVAAVNTFLGKVLEPSTIVGLWISFPALIIGSLCLLADLGQPTKAVLAGMRPGTSWIARGFWIISIFMIVAMVHTWLAVFGNAETGLLKTIAVVGIVFAVSTMAYTGILLGVSKGITFWRSGAVPVVFVISATVTGHFAIMIGLVLLSGRLESVEVFRLMAGEAALLVVFEILAIAFFLQAAWKQPDPRESVVRLLANTTFIGGYVLGGLIAPLVLMLVLYRRMPEATDSAVMTVAVIGAALGLLGGLILRWGVLRFGAMPTLNVGGFEFRRVARPKDPKAPIGLLPPQ
ncbi:MAG: NrfD/PsrC family molybdoenzyme membrane anchor subunit [Planctomycetota bacterium]|jgi:formate-dependent nitrite reductase membrane component NrfD